MIKIITLALLAILNTSKAQEDSVTSVDETKSDEDLSEGDPGYCVVTSDCSKPPFFVCNEDNNKCEHKDIFPIY